MKKLLSILLFVTAFIGSVQASDSVVAWPEQGVLIDTRTVSEFNSGHIDGAELIPYDVIQNQIASIVESKDTPIYLYCRSGNRAGKAQKTLEKLGYTQVYNLGGLDDAKQAIAK